MNNLHLTPGVLFQRRAWLMWSFVLLMGLAGMQWASQQVRAAAEDEIGLNGTLPGGTIPPGGTVPPSGTIPPANAGQIRVIHLAPFDADIADTAVDICTEANQLVSDFAGLVYLSQTGFRVFPSGNYDWKVSQPGCGATVVDIPPFTLFNNAVLTLNIIGDGVSQPLSTVLTVESIGFPFTTYLPTINRNPNSSPIR